MRSRISGHRLSPPAAAILEKMTQAMMEQASISGDVLLEHLRPPFFEQLALAALRAVADPCPLCKGDGRVKFVPDFATEEDPGRIGWLSLCRACDGCGIDPTWEPSSPDPGPQQWLEHVKTT